MIYNCSALEIPIEDNTVQCCVTSPPYYGLRDYGTAKWEGGDTNCDHLETNDTRDPKYTKQTQNAGTSKIGYKDVCKKCGAIRVDKQIGLESTPDEYVSKLVRVFREVKRVLKDDGTLWLNLGDSYCGNMSRASNNGRAGFGNPREGIFNRGGDGLKDKDLIGIPWMVAFALRADGWYLRSDIIWAKPNPMPESVKDRPTKSHEYMFLLSKSAKYYYDAEAIEEVATGYDGRKDTEYKGGNKDMAGGAHERWHYKNLNDDGQQPNTMHIKRLNGEPDTLYPVRNKRSVWTINTQPFKGAHFAVMPEKLVEPCILAGSKSGDVILDPFAGSGTVGVVAQKNGRQFVGIELNPEYVKIAEERLRGTPVSLLGAYA